jgi:hypothetical protein
MANSNQYLLGCLIDLSATSNLNITKTRITQTFSVVVLIASLLENKFNSNLYVEI